MYRLLVLADQKEKHCGVSDPLGQHKKKVVGNLPKCIDKTEQIAYNNRARAEPLRIDVALMCESA